MHSRRPPGPEPDGNHLKIHGCESGKLLGFSSLVHTNADLDSSCCCCILLQSLARSPYLLHLCESTSSISAAYSPRRATSTCADFTQDRGHDSNGKPYQNFNHFLNSSSASIASTPSTAIMSRINIPLDALTSRLK